MGGSQCGTNLSPSSETSGTNHEKSLRREAGTTGSQAWQCGPMPTAFSSQASWDARPVLATSHVPNQVKPVHRGPAFMAQLACEPTIRSSSDPSRE